MAPFPSRCAGHALPDRHGQGRDRYRRREWPALSNRATHLCHSLCHQPPCPGCCLFDCGTDIRTYSLPRPKGKSPLMESHSTPQGIAPTLIIIRVAFGLSSTTTSGRLRSGGALPSVTRSATQVRLGYSTTVYSDSGHRTTGAEIPMSQMKSKALGEDHAGAPGLVVGYVGTPTPV